MVDTELETALNAAIGREERVRDEVSAPLARRLAATLNRPVDSLEPGTDLPDGWHVILFGPAAPTTALNDDGHPPTGDFLPRLPLPRRMFAGREVFFERPLRIGDAVERVSTISDGVVKEGRSGLLAFVTVTHEIYAGSTMCVREKQTVVYREEAGKGADKPADAKPQQRTLPEDCPWTASVTPTPALLMRYSAVTFNAHRIHYDERYVREVEGYPALVVNGGLTAILLIEMVRDHRPEPLASFGVSNRKALFANRPITLMGRPDGAPGKADTASLWACDDTGALASEANLSWRKA
ncbi:MAG: MaoC family dehydratase N-terminal domain-containing protein [Acetobacterales bacterium]